MNINVIKNVTGRKAYLIGYLDISKLLFLNASKPTSTGEPK